MKKYVLIIVTFFSMGFLTAQNDSVRDPGFGKHTIGINVSSLLMGDGISLQYRRTQGKLHFRSRIDYIKKPLTTSFFTEVVINDTNYRMWNEFGPQQEIKLRFGYEKQFKWKKVNGFFGSDLIVGYRETRYTIRSITASTPYPFNPFQNIPDPFLRGDQMYETGSRIILGADVSLGVEFHLTKRLNLTTQLILPVCLEMGLHYGSLEIIPALDINLSYKLGGFKK